MLKVKLLFCALFAMMSFTAQADEDEFVVTSGDFNVVRQPGKIGRLEVDFTQAKVGNLSTMEMTDQTFIDYLKENDQKVYKKWNEYQEEAKETFMERWNDAKKKVIKLIQATLVQPPGVGTSVVAVLSSPVRWRSSMPQATASAR